MSSVADFINSPLGMFVIVIIAIIVLIVILGPLLFGKPIGQVIMEWFGNKPLKIDEIDARAHPRMVEGSRMAAKLSKDRNAKWLCLKALDNKHYVSERGVHTVGKIIGMSTYPSHVEVLIRQPWRWRKFIVIFPPDLLSSSTSNRNVCVDGTSLKELAEKDFFYPIPATGNVWTEDKMDEFANLIYNVKRVLASDIMVQQVGENTLLASAASRAETRMQMEAMKHHIYRMEEQPEQPQGGQQSGIV